MSAGVLASPLGQTQKTRLKTAQSIRELIEAGEIAETITVRELLRVLEDFESGELAPKEEAVELKEMDGDIYSQESVNEETTVSNTRIERLERAVAALCYHDHMNWAGSTQKMIFQKRLPRLVLGNQRRETINGFLQGLERSYSGSMSTDPDSE